MADSEEGGRLETPPDMAAGNPTRGLAAIMFSDVVGYTAIMGRDEHAALRALDAHRELLRTLLPKFNGRMVGEIGDGTLTSFHSAIEAVNCAREVQASLQDQPEVKLRIGIQLGDFVFSNKPGTRLKDLGEQRLKNVSRPIRVYQIVESGLIAQPAEPSGHRRRIALIAGAAAVILAGLILVLLRLKWA